jgi:creatinine amidohydrolase
MKRRTAMKSFGTIAAALSVPGGGRASSPPQGARPVKTMLEMTFPEFEALSAHTDICLLPVGSIEEHGPHLPLNSDALGAVAILGDVQARLAARGRRTIIGPCLNIGITNEGEDGAKDGTSIYPGSMTVGFRTFVNLYVDVLRSLSENGLKQVFLYSGHLGGKHLKAMAQAATEGSAKIPGLKAYALIDSERLARLDLPGGSAMLPLADGLNFPMLQKLFGGSEPSFTTHADGWETSLLLHYQQAVVRPGFADLPQVSSPTFIEAQQAGGRKLNPLGIGGFPTRNATAHAGKQIADYRTRIMADAIMGALQS